MNYEFYLINKSTKEKAIVQVKSGNVELNTKDWKNKTERVFLFQANGLYSGNSYNNVDCINPKKIKTFLENI